MIYAFVSEYIRVAYLCTARKFGGGEKSILKRKQQIFAYKSMYA